MANAMSSKSSSYSRPMEIAEFSKKFRMFSDFPVRGEFGQIAMLKKTSIFKQAVFRAELLQTKTKDEIEVYAKELLAKIENNCPNLNFKISFHLQGDDTEKSAHIHVWGDANPEVEKIVQNYIFEANLTVEKNNNNITFMEAGKKYKIDKKNETISTKNEKDENIEVNREDLFFERENKEFNELMAELDKVLKEIDDIFVLSKDDFESAENIPDSVINEALKIEISADNYFDFDFEEEE